MDNHPLSGLDHSLAGAIRYIFRVPTLSIILGLIIVVPDLLRSGGGHSVFGTRLILFGFGWSFWEVSAFRISDWSRRFCAIVFLVLSVIPTRYLILLYSYLR